MLGGPGFPAERQALAEQSFAFLRLAGLGAQPAQGAKRLADAPIWLLGFLNGVGPRVGESGFELIPGFAYTAPYENITLKGA